MMWNWHASGQQIGGGAAGSRTQGEVGCLLLTGATGFIGGNVLVAAVNGGLGGRLLCLVRAASAAEALERLRANARQCGLPPSRTGWLGEENILLGELGTAFTPAQQARLARVTHVINCAAMASFSADERVTRVNVEETLRFASHFAGSAALRRFIHVGTAMACGTRRGARVAETVIEEGRAGHGAGANGARGARGEVGMEAAAPAALDDAGGHLVPYTRSKQEVEQLLRQRYPSLPLVVARPSIVVGHTVLGTQPSGSIFWLFRIIHRTRRYTVRPQTRLDVIAGDDCAQALLRLALKPELRFRAYHLSAGAAAPTIAQVLAAMDDCARVDDALPYRACAPAELPALARDVARAEGLGNRRLIERALRLYAGFAELGYVFDNQRLRDEIGFEPLPITDYVSECMRTSRGVGLLEQMSWDFKA